MFDEHHQHLQSIKTLFSEKLELHGTITMGKSTITYTTTGQNRFERKNKESCQLGNVFRAICYEFADPSYLAKALKYNSL